VLLLLIGVLTFTALPRTPTGATPPGFRVPIGVVGCQECSIETRPRQFASQMANKPNCKVGLNPRKRPVQERSAATVDAVLEAAIRILKSHGHAAVTTTAVAELAGVSVGSLYQYFPNKSAILAELFRRHVADVITTITATDLTQAADFRSAVSLLMRSLIAAEFRQQAFSLAFKNLVHDVHGRAIATTAAGSIAQTLASLLRPHVRTPWTDHDTVRLGLAIASVEGVVWEVNQRAPSLLATENLSSLLTEAFMVPFEA
jgi:AcrR family transcriptional regulator